MLDKDIRTILKTYELPKDLEDRIFNTASGKIRELDITSFPDCYRCIDELVNSFTTPFEEGIALKLDEPIGDGTDTFKDLRFVSETPEQEVPVEGFTMPEIFRIIKDELSESESKLLSQIFENYVSPNIRINVRESDVLSMVSDIKKKLKVIEEKFVKNGELSIPEKFYIKFKPKFSIRFRRDFNKDPLRYYFDHPELHHLTRGQLASVDPNLYESLREHDLLDVAGIKIKKRDFENPLDYFRRHYQGVKTRNELKKRDQPLYYRLLRDNLLDAVIPHRRQERDYNGDPLKYFFDHPELHGLTRTQLKKKDEKLYAALLRRNQVGIAIPNKRYQDWDKNPLEYFREHPEYHGLTVSQLRKINPPLLSALRYHKQLTTAIEEKGHKERKHIGNNPFKYFVEHIDIYRDMKRKDLERFDGGLYNALRRKKQLRLAIPEKRYRGVGGDPLEFFRENSDVFGQMEREELQKIDPQLYGALKITGQLNKAIPPRKVVRLYKRHFDWGELLDYYKTNIDRYEGMSRSQLYKNYSEVYNALLKLNLLDIVIPHKKLLELKPFFESPITAFENNPEYVTYVLNLLNNLIRVKVVSKEVIHRRTSFEVLPIKENPLEYFNEHPEYHNITQNQLRLTNSTLYHALKNLNQLNDAIPLRRKIIHFDDPLKFYEEHPEYHSMDRSELRKNNRSLYITLRKLGYFDFVRINLPKIEKTRISTDPLKFYEEHPEYHSMDGSELRKSNSYLYRALRKLGYFEFDRIKLPKIERTKISTDSLKFYEEHPEYHGMRRTELRKVNDTLYIHLLRKGILDQVTPKSWAFKQFGGDPLKHYQEHPEHHAKSRKELSRTNQKLYNALVQSGQIEQAIPNTQRRYRDLSDPLKYFQEHPEYHDKTRTELDKIDQTLYEALRKKGQLEQAIPNTKKRLFKGKPLEYFREHSIYHTMTRSQLKKHDNPLYLQLILTGQLDEAIPKIKTDVKTLGNYPSV